MAQLRFGLFILCLFGMAACVVGIRCYAYSTILGIPKTEVNCLAGVTACARVDTTILGVRSISGACGGCNGTTSCTECYTDLCNSAPRSVGASAAVSLLSGALLMGVKSLLL